MVKAKQGLLSIKGGQDVAPKVEDSVECGGVLRARAALSGRHRLRRHATPPGR